MGGCQTTCPDLPCQHLLCCRGPPVQQRHSYQSPGFRFLLITFGAGKRHPSINVNPCNWRNMLIPHWVGLVDGWTDPSVTTGMFGIYKHAVRSRRWAARFTAAVKPLFYLERSTKERQEEDGIPVCVFTDLFKPSGGGGIDDPGPAPTTKPSQRWFVWLDFSGDTSIRQSGSCCFRWDVRMGASDLPSPLQHVGGREQSAHISVCLQRRQDGP